MAINNDGKIGDAHFVMLSNISRHDWGRRTVGCSYTVSLGVGPPSGSAEYLAAHYAGIDYTLWEFWGAKVRIRAHHVRRYINSFGKQGFYQEIMWPHLPEREWLALWRQRRTSGRV
jgi:hypothetical protein